MPHFAIVPYTYTCSSPRLIDLQFQQGDAEDPELFATSCLLRSTRRKLLANWAIPIAIILCWESFNVRCHRRLVVEWPEEELDIVVPELGHERSESVPFSEQPSKWDGKASQGTQSLRLFCRAVVQKPTRWPL
jgi:hypothetical protein